MEQEETAAVTFKIVWTLKNVSKASIKRYPNGACEGSEKFEISKDDKSIKWSLKIYPNGDDIKTIGQVEIFLRMVATNSDFDVKYRLGLIGEAGDLMSVEIGRKEKDYQDDSGYGPTEFLQQSELLESEKKFINEGSLTVVCEMAVNFKEKLLKASESKNDLNKSFVTSFKKFFHHELFSDFKIKTVGGNVLNVHKSILAARSEVFNKMFSTDMKEAKEGILDVSDLDYTTMKEVLRFIYCNEVENLDEIAQDLIFGAEKYDLEDLKEICVDSMIKTLTVKNVIQSVVIADSVSGGKKLFRKCLELRESLFNLKTI